MRGAPTYGALARSPGLGVLGERGGRDPLASLYNGLVAYWKLDETSGPRFDSVGSNDLTDNGGVTVGTPKVGAGSAEFDGTNYLSRSNVGVSAYPVALSFWINPIAYDTVGVVLNNDNLFLVNLHNSPQSSLSVRTGAGKFSIDTSGTGLNLSGWSHWVINFASVSSVDFYVNGVLAVLGSGTALFTRSGFQLGARGTGENEYAGLVDEVGIYNRVLTPAKIALLYGGGTPPKLF